MWQYKDTDELYHYGVLGMKWGVRRQQAKLARIEKKSKKGNWSSDATEAARIKAKGVKQATNAELKKFNERGNLENNFNNLTKRKSININNSMQKFIKTAGLIGGLAGAAKIYKNLGNNAIKNIGNWVVKDIRL